MDRELVLGPRAVRFVESIPGRCQCVVLEILKLHTTDILRERRNYNYMLNCHPKVSDQLGMSSRMIYVELSMKSSISNSADFLPAD
jgi:hypothetical protein